MKRADDDEPRERPKAHPPKYGRVNGVGGHDKRKASRRKIRNR